MKKNPRTHRNSRMRAMKGSGALRRFNWEYRRIVDTAGHDMGSGIPLDTDTRKPRARMAGAETSGFLVVHSDMNRSRRRLLARGAQFPLRGSNRPHVGKLNADNAFAGN